MLGKAVEKAEQSFRALVIANQGEHFCVGANLFMVAMAGTNKDDASIRTMVRAYQYATQRPQVRLRPRRGRALRHDGRRRARALLRLLLGAGRRGDVRGARRGGRRPHPRRRGHAEHALARARRRPEGTNIIPFEFVAQTFKNIALVKVATSADEAKAFGYFRRGDGVSFDRARQLTEAKARAIGLAEAGYHAPVPRAFRLPGASGIATLGMLVDTLVAGGQASPHDALIANKLAVVLCGGPGGASRDVTEDEMLELEREAFVSLACEPKSLERMQFMLLNNKPLRN